MPDEVTLIPLPRSPAPALRFQSPARAAVPRTPSRSFYPVFGAAFSSAHSSYSRRSGAQQTRDARMGIVVTGVYCAAMYSSQCGGASHGAAAAAGRKQV